MVAGALRVLIVDDNAEVRVMLSRMLSRYSDLDVMGTVQSGEEACTAAAADPPDVVLMDVRMAGMGGIEAARWLKVNVPSARIVGMSADDEGPTASAMREAGAVEFVPKTASVDQLIHALKATAPADSDSSRAEARPGSDAA
ncbi:MAG TPA: response regulator transcription factor [Pirellulaceae bacterium]|jgi:two-component system invasion response regulator UvrY|nr:response regulator transcription factor [Pirellulaceae bacterium]